MIKLRINEKITVKQDSPMYSASVYFCPEGIEIPPYCD